MREGQKFEPYMYTYVCMYMYMCVYMHIYISRFSITKSWACSSVPEREFDPNTKTTQSFNGLPLFLVVWAEAQEGPEGRKLLWLLGLWRQEAETVQPDCLMGSHMPVALPALRASYGTVQPPLFPSCIVPLPQTHTFFSLCELFVCFFDSPALVS